MGFEVTHTINNHTHKYTYQLAALIQTVKQKNRFALLDTHMGHIFMKYVLLSFFKTYTHVHCGSSLSISDLR